MPVPKNHEITMRCPVCFNREIDVLMRGPQTPKNAFGEPLKYEDGHYSCLKCSFVGTEREVRQLYKDIRKKFKWIGKRVTIEDYEQL